MIQNIIDGDCENLTSYKDYYKYVIEQSQNQYWDERDYFSVWEKKYGFLGVIFYDWKDPKLTDPSNWAQEISAWSSDATEAIVEFKIQLESWAKEINDAPSNPETWSGIYHGLSHPEEWGGYVKGGINNFDDWWNNEVITKPSDAPGKIWAYVKSILFIKEINFGIRDEENEAKEAYNYLTIDKNWEGMMEK